MSTTNKRALILSITLYVVILILFAIFLSTNTVIVKSDAKSILLGIASSIIASLFIMIFFTLTSERDFANYVAEAASERATTEVLKKLSLAPSEIYDAADKPNPRFEQKFKEEFSGSPFYYLFGASGDFAAERIKNLAEEGGLKDREIRILILDPANDSLLESHARMRIAANGAKKKSTAQARHDDAAQNSSEDELKKETKILRDEIFSTLEKLIPVSINYDLDVKFHESFTFFRSEFFESGFFLTFMKGHQDFPGSAYYDKKSSVYGAYKQHFNHYFKYKDFSLQKLAREKKTADEIKAIAKGEKQ